MGKIFIGQEVGSIIHGKQIGDFSGGNLLLPGEEIYPRIKKRVLIAEIKNPAVFVRLFYGIIMVIKMVGEISCIIVALLLFFTFIIIQIRQSGHVIFRSNPAGGFMEVQKDSGRSDGGFPSPIIGRGLYPVWCQWQ